MILFEKKKIRPKIGVGGLGFRAAIWFFEFLALKNFGDPITLTAQFWVLHMGWQLFLF